MAQPEKFIEDLFNQGILVSEDLLETGIEAPLLNQIKIEEDLIVLNSDYVGVIKQQSSLVDWYEIDKYRVQWEKDKDETLYQSQLQHLRHLTLSIDSPSLTQQQEVYSLESQLTTSNTSEVKPSFTSIAPLPVLPPETYEPPLPRPSLTYSLNVLISFINVAKKHEVKDFSHIFVTRYRFLRDLLSPRQELNNVLPIARLSGRKEQSSIIGIVEEIATSKNGNLIFTVEDFTGRMKVLVSQSKKEVFDLAKDVVHDEVIGITGTGQDSFFFADSIVWPDIPATHELKKGEVEEYVIFLSDIHVGSALFLKEEFERFLRWINGKVGNEQQKAIASKVKYIFVVGDLVDGVGIYPAQEEELAIKDIREQYNEFARLMQQIPADKALIMCPGNHDVVHLAEPQPTLYKEYAAALYQLPNVTLVTNPSLINIGQTKTFSGFDVLLYHGYSFDYYVANVESIRAKGGYHRADLIMKFLLKRRHLAPSFKSTPYFPGHAEDPLLIKKIPDFFATGHIHYSSIANYKGITMISGSCWQGKTSFQEKLGHEPEPARVPLINLKTREIKVLRFM